MKRLFFLLLCTIACAALSANEIKPVLIPEDFGARDRFTIITWAYFPKELGAIDAKGFGIQSCTFVSRGDLLGGVQFCLGEKEGIPEFKMFIPGKGWVGFVASSGKLRFGSRVMEKSALPKIQTGKWHQFAGVKDGSRMILFMDGEQLFTYDGAPAAPSCEGPACLGGLKQNVRYWTCRFAGYLDKYVLLSEALPASEIGVRYRVEQDNLNPTPSGIRPFAKPEMSEKLPIVQKWELKQEHNPIEKGECTAKVVMQGGRPRLKLNGEIVDATLALPPVLKDLNTNTRVLQDFAAAGVKFYMDIWFTRGKLNNWWLGPGKYDFKAFDDRMMAILAADPDGYIMPRIKLDPPEWWEKENPGHMLAGYVNPASTEWHALFEQMLRDVINHIDNSKYASRIIGYNFGAMVGSEWISRRNDEPRDYNPEYWQQRADAVSVPALKAAHIIKEISGGNKLAGVFFGYPLAEHGNLMQLVESPDIDFFCSPVTYNGRRGGEPGRFSTPYQATYRLHGKLYWSESDERTHHSEYRGLWHPAWHLTDEDETDGVLMRDVAWALTSGHEIWWFAIAGPETFHNERIMQTISRAQKLAENRPDKPRVSEIAVFTPVWYAPDPAEKREKVAKGTFLNHIVPTCGVPVDSYELKDLGNPDLPKYKAAIVLTGTHGYMPKPSNQEMKLWVIENESELPKTPKAMREWCEKMGAHVWSTTDDTFGAGCGYAFIHAGIDGDKVIRFPGGKTWKGKMKFGETKIIRY